MARSSAQTGARTRFVLGAAVLSATLVAAAVLASRELRVVVPASDGVVPAVQYVGITYIPLSHEVAARYSLEVESGLLVTEVASDGPAARAGLRRGDVLLSADSAPLSGSAGLVGPLVGKRPGDRISLLVQREGSQFSAELTVGARR